MFPLPLKWDPIPVHQSSLPWNIHILICVCVILTVQNYIWCNSLDPAVYPYYNLYPATAASEVEVIPNEPLPTMLQTAYPVLNICMFGIPPFYHYFWHRSLMVDPACYPHFDIYPSYWVVDTTDLKLADVQPPSHPAKLALPGCSGYPDFSLCE